MLSNGERVVVALSGGADSVCLALTLKELGYEVRCVHVNHNLRGEESDRDEAFCREFCKANHLPLEVESVDVMAFCAENKRSLEDGARALRYEALRRLCKGDKLATAHNLNDCLETTIFNLTRGCGIKGILGIPPVRDNIIRPLLNITREEIESFLSSCNQSFVTDSTNLTDDCSRNIIRLNVLPELQRINPGILGTYSAELSSWQETEDYVLSAAKLSLDESLSGDGYDLSGIKDEAILSRVIALILKENEIGQSFERIQRIKSLLKTDGRINIQKGVYISCASGKLTVTDSSLSEKLYKKVILEGEIETFGKKIIITKLSQTDISSLNNKRLKYILDADKLKSETVLRSYLGNEKIKLFGRDFTSTVKKLISKTPPHKRNGVIVIADDDGAVFVEGFGIADRVKIDSSTQNAAEIRIIKA